MREWFRQLVKVLFARNLAAKFHENKTSRKIPNLQYSLLSKVPIKRFPVYKVLFFVYKWLPNSYFGKQWRPSWNTGASIPEHEQKYFYPPLQEKKALYRLPSPNSDK